MVLSGANIRFYPATETSSAWVRKTYISHQKRERERYAYEVMQGFSLTPRLRASGQNALGQAYNDLDWIDGGGYVLNLRDDTQNWRSVGILLGKMVHYSCGIIAEKGIPTFELFRKSYAWAEFIRDKIDGWEERILSSEKFKGRMDFRPIMQSCKTMLPEMTMNDIALIHGDYTQQNIIWDKDNQIWKIVDFGAALIGDPRFDLGKIIWVNGALEDSVSIKAFISAWSAASALDVSMRQVSFYARLHALAAMDWVIRQEKAQSLLPVQNRAFVERALLTLKSPLYF